MAQPPTYTRSRTHPQLSPLAKHLIAVVLILRDETAVRGAISDVVVVDDDNVGGGGGGGDGEAESVFRDEEVEEDNQNTIHALEAPPNDKRD